MKHQYHIECFHLDKWIRILQGSLQFCQGFLHARKDYSPRLAYRLMRSDGRVMEEVPACEDVNIGQIAGWPTAKQYEQAAAKALDRAKAIRSKETPTCLTHYSPFCNPPWMAIHRQSAFELLKGCDLTNVQKTDIGCLMAGYCNVLDQAGLLHYGKTEAEAVAKACGLAKPTEVEK